MAHIQSIGAGVFSDMSLATPTVDLTPAAIALLDTAAEFQALFVTEILSGGAKGADTFNRIENVREFPAMGTPPNIVNVPVFGSKTSQQVQGQADAPTVELTLNYVASDWAKGTILGDAIGDGVQHAFRFTMMNAEPLGYDSNAIPANGIGSVENSQYYWIGKIEALLVNTQLTDATTATLTISTQSELFGAFTE
jgi:hypothetical protein